MKRNHTLGFTIVELLIVIVVIAILAAITVVAFNGVQQRANDSATQTALNQMYKKVELARTTGEFDITNKAQFMDLIKGINLDGIDTQQEHPIIFGRSFSYAYDEATGTHSYPELLGITAISKSGNVYYVTEETGGVVQEITNWQQLINSLETVISDYERYRDYPGNTQEDIDWYNVQIQSFRDQIVVYRQNIDNGTTYVWTATLAPTDSCYDNGDPDRACFDNYSTPVNTYTFSDIYGGYVYSSETKTWRQIINWPSSGGVDF